MFETIMLNITWEALQVQNTALEHCLFSSDVFHRLSLSWNVVHVLSFVCGKVLKYFHIKS